ncbi:DUF2192 domain-containing protein [Stygiolobus caldivivus]|uniref:DUF2192 domain-containing protein n=1 Tax=Stygiolobus caldivivus TaxID=2824673 RepID=A0A8D5U9T9_9CREN|nr:DUF2192 domain-containing protein [Stygiolobus caldivivus]BCU71304.1 hypothetical protein KN1_26010 [Stygiolobus caldivivus]
MVKDLYKERVKVLTDIWGKILENTNVTRDQVLEVLEKSYEEKHIKPIRGFKADGLYEKELISLYVVGKDGLGLMSDYEELFIKIFTPEIKFDNASQLIAENRPLEAYEALDKDKSSLAKTLRLIFTEGIFSFKPEDTLYNALRVLNSVNVDEVQHTAVSFARFYTAFKLAEGIATKNIRDKLSLEAQKRAIAINIGIKYPLPKPEYIAMIAEKVFSINPKIVKKIIGS